MTAADNLQRYPPYGCFRMQHHVFPPGLVVVVVDEDMYHHHVVRRTAVLPDRFVVHVVPVKIQDELDKIQHVLLLFVEVEPVPKDSTTGFNLLFREDQEMSEVG